MVLEGFQCGMWRPLACAGARAVRHAQRSSVYRTLASGAGSSSGGKREVPRSGAELLTPRLDSAERFDWRNSDPFARPNDRQEGPVSWEAAIADLDFGSKLRRQRYPERVNLGLREICVRKLRMKGSVKKVNMVAKLIRKLPVPLAMAQLRYSKKARSNEMLRMMNAGVEAAKESHGLSTEELFVGIVNLGRGPYLKRIDIKGRGRTGLITIPCTHVTMVLREKPTLEHWNRWNEKKAQEIDEKGRLQGQIHSPS